jgi:hypothetical protein
MSDEAGEERLHQVAKQIVALLDDRLDFSSSGLFAYHNFRTVSEQSVLREEAWA